MTRRKIVAISGSGRTGSTLLSLLLSQHSGIFNLGQLRDLWAAWADDAPCSCGRTLRTCHVYAPVAREAFGADPAAGMQQMRRAMKAFFADARRIPDWSAADRVQALARAHSAFLVPLAAVLEALQRATGAHTYIDASKSPEMALALSLADGSDVRVLNLVRDPRAIAVSWHKRRGGWRTAWDSGRTWAQRQRQLSRWSRALGTHFLELRYEDFAADGRGAVTRVEQWAALDPTATVFETADRARISWDGQHLYPPANERVLAERATAVTIRPADDWRGAEHRLQHWLALLATGRAGRQYARSGRSYSADGPGR
jgi:hypothetical protein